MTGVTADNNAAVLLAQVIRPLESNRWVSPEFYSTLKIPAPAEASPSLVTIRDFLAGEHADNAALTAAVQKLRNECGMLVFQWQADERRKSGMDGHNKHRQRIPFTASRYFKPSCRRSIS
jgi:hypothetical protein